MAFDYEAWKRRMAELEKRLQAEKEKEEKTRKHWLWSNSSIKRYDEVLEKYGRFKRRKED